ncbi:manganese-dependent inorganic pyrophosphatase [Vibrio sp. SS-MA-C1-2]|nr:manganese-dependent inorganic pyrophosphatase [Vibrio sp. SS-MA-C1-2]UJF18732.1 manganese-dependent inorganic pyrophosphatase [Vibrio sp. SS-MA-C1-2]
MKKTAIALMLFGATNVQAFDLNNVEKNDVSNLVWTGHTSPDSDTTFSAMIAADIFGGQAVTTSEINPESQFIVDYCQVEAPVVATNYAGKTLGLVDFNQQTQLASSIEQNNIVAIIDHHAIGGMPINAPQIISMDFRPWGSTATILADKAEQLGHPMSKEIACITLGAILSDTVLLSSPITTDYDRQYAEKMAKIAGIQDVDGFGEQMINAKSDVSNLSAATILTLDYKNFEFGGKKVGIGVAETITPEKLIARKAQFFEAMKAHKEAAGLDYLFFSITDTKDKKANLLWVDGGEAKVLSTAFNVEIDSDLLTLEGVTSRKRQIGPAIQSALEK